jgi:hypothetical protein
MDACADVVARWALLFALWVPLAPLREARVRRFLSTKAGHLERVVTWWRSDGGREYCETQGMDEAVAWALWIRAPPYVYGARGEESSWARAWAGTDTGPDTTNIDGRAVTVDDDDQRETMYEAASYQAFIRGTLSRFYGGGGSESDDD